MEPQEETASPTMTQVEHVLHQADFLSVPDLETVVADLTNRLAVRKQIESQKDLDDLKRLAAKLGATVALPAKKAKPAVKKPLPNRFADPANPANGWTGRGRKPAWLAAYIAQGRQPSEFMLP